MRRRVEDRAEEVLTPYFDALAHGEDVEQRMRAAERLLDRVYGRPKQSAELSGGLSVDDQRRLDEEIEQEIEKLLEARARGLNGHGR